MSTIPERNRRMRGKGSIQVLVALVVVAAVAYWAGRRSAPQLPPEAESAARGAQLVEVGGCDDCHTPKMPDHSLDLSVRFSGYHADTPLPPTNEPGTMTANAQVTAFRGDWGVSKARNITSDPTTGIGNWTLDQFIQTMRSGVDPAGMKIMPPMPVEALSHASTADLTAIYNYLRTVKPVVNQVTGE